MADQQERGLGSMFGRLFGKSRERAREARQAELRERATSRERTPESRTEGGFGYRETGGGYGGYGGIADRGLYEPDRGRFAGGYSRYGQRETGYQATEPEAWHGRGGGGAWRTGSEPGRTWSEGGAPWRRDEGRMAQDYPHGLGAYGEERPSAMERGFGPPHEHEEDETPMGIGGFGGGLRQRYGAQREEAEAGGLWSRARGGAWTAAGARGEFARARGGGWRSRDRDEIRREMDRRTNEEEIDRRHDYHPEGRGFGGAPYEGRRFEGRGFEGGRFEGARGELRSRAAGWRSRGRDEIRREMDRRTNEEEIDRRHDFHPRERARYFREGPRFGEHRFAEGGGWGRGPGREERESRARRFGPGAYHHDEYGNAEYRGSQPGERMGGWYGHRDDTGWTGSGPGERAGEWYGGSESERHEEGEWYGGGLHEARAGGAGTDFGNLGGPRHGRYGWEASPDRGGGRGFGGPLGRSQERSDREQGRLYQGRYRGEEDSYPIAGEAIAGRGHVGTEDYRDLLTYGEGGDRRSRRRYQELREEPDHFRDI